MKKKTLESCGTNSGKVEYNPKTSREIEIKRGKYSFGNESVHPLFNGEDKYFKRIDSLEMGSKVIYYFMLFGSKENVSGVHVGFNFFGASKIFMVTKFTLVTKRRKSQIRYKYFFSCNGTIC